MWLNGEPLGGNGLPFVPFGFEVTGPGITFARNQSLFCGRGGGGGILFGSDGGVIQDSLARGSGGPGIRASGAGVIVRRNRAIDNGGDGIGLFGATGALVAGNLARDNAGTGLLVDATAADTTVERNTAFRNLRTSATEAPAPSSAPASPPTTSGRPAPSGGRLGGVRP